jgi:hypothetical protein
VKSATLHRAGVLAGLLAGPFFLISVGLNTWASRGYLHQLGWEFVGGEQVPWPSSLACGPYGWAQVATFVITGLLIVVLAGALRDELPHRRAIRGRAVRPVGSGVMLAGFRVDVPMLSGGSPATWHDWVHGIAFLLIIATCGRGFDIAYVEFNETTITEEVAKLIREQRLKPMQEVLEAQGFTVSKPGHDDQRA